ncbi:uncharacterized protein LOC144887345 [Branchiostoma floridae x Branchiostoma japonicum]
MGKRSGDGTFRTQTRHGDTRRLQLALAGTVCLFVSSLLMNVLVYVRLTAAITDLSRRLEEVEGRQDSHRSSVYPDRLASNAPDVVTAKGQGSMQDTADNQSLTHFALRSRQSGPMRKRSARTICHSNEYECQNGGCIYSRWQCDGDNDCTDDSDEYPLNEKCIPLYSTYRCRNGKTIPSKFQCDGGNDCRDGSDEYPLNEDCNPAYRCKNGRQIPSNWQCDGDDDCHDSSDEYPLNEECHLCKNGRQIPSKWQCDGDNDCHDGSDEYPLNEECNPCDFHQCQNNATCNDTVDGYTCICVKGWRGEYCEHKIDPCETHQCLNNATCHTTEDGYICNCTDDWRGEYCQQKMDPCERHQCQNNATCRANKDGYKCSCTEGWRGKYCQRKRRNNQWKKYGSQLAMIPLLSVHIPARTDTSVRRGATAMVKVIESATFTQWRDITERRFRLHNGYLEIKEPGKYLIYSQVDFYNASLKMDAKYSIKKSTEPQLTCVTPLVGWPPRHTCYTAGVLDLESGDKLVLSVACTECYVLTYDDTTFWGAIKLSS